MSNATMPEEFSTAEKAAIDELRAPKPRTITREMLEEAVEKIPLIASDELFDHRLGRIAQLSYLIDYLDGKRDSI